MNLFNFLIAMLGLKLTFNTVEGDGGGAPTTDILSGGNNPPADDGGTSSANDGGTPPELSEFLMSLPEDLRAEASLKDFKDVGSLAKSYIHAQRMVGKDRVVLPDAHASQEDWRAFMHKVGLPESDKDYQLEMYEDANVTEDFAKTFKAKAFEAGILPAQAQIMLDSIDEMIGQDLAAQQASSEEAITNAMNDLQTTYGEALNAKLGLANRLLDETISPELRKSIDSAGLGNNADFIKMLVSIADKFTKEDSFHVNDNPLGVMSPDEAQSEIDRIYSDKSHPYFNSTHVSHDNAVKHMEKLFKFVHGAK